jgi:hypothetical protein
LARTGNGQGSETLNGVSGFDRCQGDDGSNHTMTNYESEIWPA